MTECWNIDPICIIVIDANVFGVFQQALHVPYNWIQSAVAQHIRRKHFSPYLDRNAHFIKY